MLDNLYTFKLVYMKYNKITCCKYTLDKISLEYCLNHCQTRYVFYYYSLVVTVSSTSLFIMSATAVLKFIHEIKSVWSRSDNEEAQNRAEKLSGILDNGIPIFDEWENELKCDPPSVNFTTINTSSELSNTKNKKIYSALVEAFDSMPWKHPRQLSNSLTDILGGEDKFKSAMLIGTRKLGAVIESNEMYLGLTYLSPGTTYPQHAHDATELYFTILGSALWGPSMRHLKIVTPGNFVLHSSAQPHAFQVNK